MSYARQAIALQPNNPDAHDIVIRTLVSRRELDKAKQEFAVLSKAYPNSHAVHNLGALIYLASKQMEPARASYLRALQIRPNDLEALGGITTLDLASKRQAEALARIDSVASRAEPGADLLFLAARTYLTVGDAAKAESLLRRGIEADPDRLQGYILLGQLYVRQRKADEAIAQFRDVLKRNPRSVPSGTMIGVLLEYQNKIPEAEQEYRRVLGVDSRAAVAANNLAWLLVSSGRDLNQALSFAQVASEMMPGEPNVADTLGWIYYRLNRSSDADATPGIERQEVAGPSGVQLPPGNGMRRDRRLGDGEARAETRARAEARLRRCGGSPQEADDHRRLKSSRYSPRGPIRCSSAYRCSRCFRAVTLY